MRACVVIPAYDTEETVGDVVAQCRAVVPSVLVVDDGSHDRTGRAAADAGADVVALGINRGKGAALVAGLATALVRGFDVALTVDADGQHSAEDLPKLLAAGGPRSIVLGVRDLAEAGAPKANQVSNGISNYFLSRFAHRPLRDTQCGLRRYPILDTLALGAGGTGYEWEAEVLLRALHSGMDVVEVPIRVIYPPGKSRKTHFVVRRDVPRIIEHVLRAQLGRPNGR